MKACYNVNVLLRHLILMLLILLNFIKIKKGVK